MAKLIKILVLLGILVAAVAVYVHFSSSSKSSSTNTTAAKPAAKTDGPPQVQEKYGFAPVGQ